jgi:hypothetical protein
MTTMEERLTSALAARAELVQIEDLRPLEVPDVAARSPWRRPAAYGLLAAACAAVVLVPVGLATLGGDEDNADPSGEGADWPVSSDISGIDMDGDGLQDAAVMRLPDDSHAARLDVELGSGEHEVLMLDGTGRPSLGARARTLTDTDALVVYRDTGEVSVVVLGQDGLVVPPRDGSPFTTGLHDGVLTDVWTDGEKLYSSESHEGGYVAGEIPDDYRVDAFYWRITAEDLIRGEEPLGERCVVDGNDPVPCIEGPKFYPGPADPIHAGQSFVGSTDAGDVRVSLEGSDGEEVEAGEVRLVASLPGGSEVSADVPAGYRPTVDRALLDLGDTWGLHVSQGMGDSLFTTTLYVYRNGNLEVLEPGPGAPFENAGEGGETVVNWINEDGEIFSRRGQGELDTTRHQIWQWRYVGGELVPESAGTWCFDWFANPTTWGTCP